MTRPPDPEPTTRDSPGRTRLLDAAAVLLDENGIDGTTGAAVTAKAGNRNAAAVNYHFGNLDGLIRAVVNRHSDAIDATRTELLDGLERSGPVAPDDALAAMVAPLVGLLDNPAGRRHIRLLNQAANHPRFRADATWEYAPSIARGAAHLAPLVAHLPQYRQRPRARNVLGFVLYSLASRASALDNPTPDEQILTAAEFHEDLIATVLAALAA